MINTIIIEGDLPAKERLISILNTVSSEINILETFSSVKESIEGLKKNMPVDLIFCDVQLPDGLSFEIFNKGDILAPAIFVTDFDQFTLHALHNNGIYYLLKPVNDLDIYKAIVKYKKLQKHFHLRDENLKNTVNSITKSNKTRLLVKKGIENISIKLDDIVIIYTENRITYVLDNTGKKYLSDQSLGQLEIELSDSIFFRANRQCIINLNFIKCFKPYENVKIQVELTVPHYNQFITISQKSAPDFRSWIMKW